MAKAKVSAATKTYICGLKDGNTRKITVPANWKLTFGNVVPFSKRDGQYQNGSSIALRFYEGTKENLRAVFTDVVEIRDASMEIIEKRTTVQRQTAQKATSQGMKDVVVEARVTEWINPDKEDETPVPQEFLQLPQITANEL